MAQYGYSVESLGFNLDAFRPQTDEDIRSRIERLININRALNSLLLVNNRSEVTEVTAAEKDAKLAEVVETFERLGTPKPEASKAGPEVAWEEKIMRHLATLEESYGIDAKELGVDAEAFEKIEDNRTNLRDQIDRLMAINRAIEALVNQMKQAERLGVDPQETESLIENVRDAYIIAVPDEPIDYAKLWDPVSRVEVNCGVVATAFEKMDADLARTFASKYGTGTVMLSDILGKLDADVFESVSKAYISKGESPSASWPRAMVYQLVLAQAEFEGTDIPAGKSADGLFAVNRAYADHMIRFHNPEKSYAKPKTTSPAYQAQEALRNRLKTLIEKADRRAALTKSRLSAK